MFSTRTLVLFSLYEIRCSLLRHGFSSTWILLSGKQSSRFTSISSYPYWCISHFFKWINCSNRAPSSSPSISFRKYMLLASSITNEFIFHRPTSSLSQPLLSKKGACWVRSARHMAGGLKRKSIVLSRWFCSTSLSRFPNYRCIFFNTTDMCSRGKVWFWMKFAACTVVGKAWLSSLTL